jgi:hypothetical protein
MLHKVALNLAQEDKILFFMYSLNALCLGFLIFHWLTPNHFISIKTVCNCWLPTENCYYHVTYFAKRLSMPLPDK